jgi:hypothetical protein
VVFPDPAGDEIQTIGRSRAVSSKSNRRVRLTTDANRGAVSLASDEFALGFLGARRSRCSTFELLAFIPLAYSGSPNNAVSKNSDTIS